MRRTLLLLAGLTAAAGCHHARHNLSARYPEEYVVPPSEPRFDNPPESAYRRPTPKKDFTPGPGMGGPPGVAGPRGGVQSVVGQ
jgi:hypothetical protein